MMRSKAAFAVPLPVLLALLLAGCSDYLIVEAPVPGRVRLQIEDRPPQDLGTTPIEWEVPEDLKGARIRVDVDFQDGAEAQSYAVVLKKDDDTVIKAKPAARLTK